MNDKNLHVFLLPSSNRNNKYIQLLKNGLNKADPSINIHELPSDDLFNIWEALRAYDYSKTRNILHIQWPTVLYGSRFILKSLYLIIRNSFFIFLLKKKCGLKVIWTVHNFYAHDYPHSFIDHIGTSMIRFFADEIIVQQERTLSDYKTRYPNKSISYIPHGNYMNAYGPMIGRDNQLAASLGFSKDDIILLSLGVIAPYKRNEKIIEAFLIAKKENPSLKLLIAGKGDPEYVESLNIDANKEQGIIIRNAFIPDRDIPKHLSIADYSVFYYDHSEMTSGGLMLSLSYGLPSIIRDIPASEVIKGENGQVFDSDQKLVRILKSLKKPSNPDIIRDTIESVRKFDWTGIGTKLVDLYRRI